MNNEVTEVTKESANSKITISSLLGALKKFLLIICIATVVVGVAVGAYVGITSKTRYSASIRFGIPNTKLTSSTIDSGALSAAAAIADNCVELIDEELVAYPAVTQHGLDKALDLEVESAIKYVSGCVSASKDGTDSPNFTVTVVTYSREDTAIITAALQDVLPEVINQYYGGDFDSSATNIRLEPLTYSINVNPVRTNPVTYALIGAVIAFVISYIICFFIYINDTKVYDDSTIKAHFSAPVIGIIPEWNLPGQQANGSKSKKRAVIAGDKRDYKGKLLSSSTPFGVMEAFNTLRTNLCYSTAAEKCPVFAITSDFSGAGKSVISANVATSLAMLGKKTLLVECDLRRPELAEVFEVEKKTGLSELLSGVEADFSKVVTKVNIENLDVVLSGRIPPNPSELLGSEAMASFIAQCKENYDIIIVDTPPAYEVSDVGVIVSLLTGTVMVARSHYSDINAITASEELITGVNGRIVGYVVNDVDFKSGNSYYRKKKYGYRGYRKYARYYYSSYSTDKKSEENNA